MAVMAKGLPMAAATIFLFLALFQSLQITEAKVGVCYGKHFADNLPPIQDVVNLYQEYGIREMRIYDHDEEVLEAVQGSGVQLMIGVINEDITSMGSNPSVATQFVQDFVVPYAMSIKYIAVGNEVPMNSSEAQFILPAMQNVQNALNCAYLGGQIKVSTAINQNLLNNPYPPSSAEFTNISIMGPIVNFLVRNKSPLLLNIFTYFSYADGTIDDLSYALFTSPKPKFTDPKTGLQYQNLFDAIMDAAYTALNKAEAQVTYNTNALRKPRPTPKRVASESGWAGGFSEHKPDSYNTNGDIDAATLDNAETYYRNLIAHVKKGTPLRPQEPIEVFLFEMFDEDKKPGNPVEKHFGLFTPDECPKYNLTFN